MEAADWKSANVATSTSAPGEGGAAVASYTPLSSSFLCFFLLLFFFLKRQTVVAVSRRTKSALIGSALGNTACSLSTGHHDWVASYPAAGHVHSSEAVGGGLLKELQLIRSIVGRRGSRTRLHRRWSNWCRTGTTCQFRIYSRTNTFHKDHLVWM